MAKCACCTHPELAAIDAACVAGESIRTIGARYGMSHTAVRRHKRDHISAALVAVAAAERDTSALARVEHLIERMEAQLDAAEASGQAGLALSAGAQIRANIELLAKLTHELDTRPVTVVNLQTTPEWLTVRAALFEALMAYPEARVAAARAVDTAVGRLQIEAP
jgi:hypothetical protein